ncbi:hypothetical protein UFOVP810_12 [uncultured Caudovirales phage]|uniref:PD-(D/E)XK nuclease superfamily n=1 Tax=uncultured Caudovirales phage TaxID=2100421 RepID=A0A6J5NV07_9CAUD|nr:hypothetical protein UFOVP810_12 [uncultured Caudovirales phage]
MTWANVQMRLATPDDYHLDSFDFTKLTAINTCPTWGIIRYSMHKTMHGGGRAMALEAGKVMHECFAAVRLYTLGLQSGFSDLFDYHGHRLFGSASSPSHWEELRAIAVYPAGDNQTRCRNFTLEVLATRGYVDDPFDKRRTYTNLENSLLYYIQRQDFTRYPIWKRGESGTADVGIEIPFAVRFDCTAVTGEVRSFLYTGRIDGIHVNGDSTDQLIIGENKTASRLDESWSMSWHTSHQITGYCMAASLFTGKPVRRGHVIGLSLPLPTRDISQGFRIEDVKRSDEAIQRWLGWVEHTVTLHDKYRFDVESAPMYTHSCNRYFRPCMFVPYCASPADDRKDMLALMTTDEWSPLHEQQTGD